MINADVLQLTVPASGGVRELQTERVSIVEGEQPPPDLSECGRMASSRM